MTDTLDIGALRSAEGFFLVREPRPPRVPFVMRNDERDGAYRHVFTYANSRPVIKESVLELLASARHRVFVASFRIGEPDLLEALYAAAARMRGGVYVISAIEERSLRQGLGVEDADAPGADDIRAQNKRFEDLTGRGIAVRGHEFCHAKLLVVDDRAALVSSANLETPALVDSQARGATGENGVVVNDRVEVDRLARFFTRLWYECSWEMPPGEAHTVQHRAPSPSPCRVAPAAVGEAPAVIWTHDDERGILDTIHDVIAGAREQLLLSTFSLNGMAQHRDLLLEPLERAMGERSLDVSLLARARNLETHRQDAQALSALGVTVYGDSLNHAKAVIADGCRGALFSANFDAKHGLLSGVEAGVRLDGEPALSAAARYFDHAIEHAELVFTPRPSQRELAQRLGAGWRKRWPFELDLRVAASDGVWERFRDAAETAPVLFTCEGSAKLRLYAGADQWTVGDRLPGGARRLGRAVTADPRDAAHVLRSWLSPRGGRDEGTAGVSRGFCPASVRRVRPDR